MRSKTVTGSSHPAQLEAEIGYSARLLTDWVFVSADRFDYASMTISPDIVSMRTALRKLRRRGRGGSNDADIVSSVYFAGRKDLRLLAGLRQLGAR